MACCQQRVYAEIIQLFVSILLTMDRDAKQTRNANIAFLVNTMLGENNSRINNMFSAACVFARVHANTGTLGFGTAQQVYDVVCFLVLTPF
jgi:hypothetical protein